ncbi:restriction endonuclease subunit S [Pyxidicoccus xibeiensis]|uniref:restriction endonuclease subunit S n=1 Tax=Pyxidicoccus xibeiensis TaxID=2906759 RepID=UPI0020A741B9|nr:restriction endonuclease subunit S [Pyxidicoccus xibeiensis]MCP3137787.1 restriction endonuclease subunit S [Pyxidicoccus xibeiensis]
MPPDGWSRAKLSDLIAELESGVSVNSEDRPTSPGEIGVLKTSAVTYGRFNPQENKAVIPPDLSRVRTTPRTGEIIISRMNTQSLVGASVYVDRDYPHLFLPDRLWQTVFRQPDALSTQWLSYVLASPKIRERMSAMATGTSGSMKNLTKGQLLSLDVNVPPLPEQHKIAAILSSMDDTIDKTQAIIDQLEVVKRGLLRDLLTRGIPGWHSEHKLTPIGKMPEGWTCRPLGFVIERIDTGWSPLCDAQPAPPGEWGVLKISSVTWGEFRPEENKRLPSGMEPRPEAEVHEGDLLVSRANTKELVGRSVLVTGAPSRLMASDKLLRLRLMSQRATAAFINFALSTDASRAQIEDAATGSSGSMKNISQEKLRSIMVPLPPLDEQISIAAALDSISQRIQRERSVLDEIRNLKSALLCVLLSGEVRVTFSAQEAA